MMYRKSAVFVPLPNGDMVSLTNVFGLKALPDGRVVLLGEDSNSLASFDPEEYSGVLRDEAIKALRRMIIDVSEGKRPALPEWMAFE
ncbi:hypothetical protein [Aliirhizobium cellulosilyticum]|uniref:Uncharacterized protein n=1 Tax=Aliirhizobium cellulosilyticum TaxID=393664 RepID=A0A7W6Y2Q0_9HYPH|nr:hypothetical protein [Rhizobium cellulosilyticum]MBB4347014.1 hypothetical protein [Rhizobium cellulosilyticum]MBB4410592.1 hypothetical protein [Rhizobium cellulosilyticum]MBB4445280.1 hypothetical protein [Rhizobium cellulosilyticum]